MGSRFHDQSILRVLLLLELLTTIDVRVSGEHGEFSVMPMTVSMATLKNATTMTCTDAFRMPYVRMVQLSEEHLRSMFEAKGGSYVHDYMANTQEEAIENFPNMLILTNPTQVEGANTTFNLMDNMVTKQIVMQDLHKLSQYLLEKTDSSTESPSTDSGVSGGLGTTPEPVSLQTGPRLGSTTGSLTTAPTYQSTTTTTSANAVFEAQTSTATTDSANSTSTSRRTSLKQVLSHTATKDHVIFADKTTDTYSETMTTSQSDTTTAATTAAGETDKTVSTAKHVVSSSPTKDTGSTGASVRGTSSGKTTTSTTVSTPTKRQSTNVGKVQILSTQTAYKPTSTVDPEVLKGLDQLNQYVQGNLLNESKEPHNMSNIWRDADTTLHPATLLGLAAGTARRKRNADGSHSVEEYCQNKGSQTEDHSYIHLCSLCAATTQLPDGYFPRYINEAVCKSGDSGCFTVGATAHGQCKQTRFSLNMMRKRLGQCQMLIHGGETLVFDDWELVPTMIRVACECTINKLSAFSKYVAGEDMPIG